MKTGILVTIGLVAVALAVVVGQHISASPTAPATWYRLSHGATLVTDGSGVTYMYWPSSEAGVVAKIEPTPDEFLSHFRQTEVYYYSDSHGDLSRTYIPWDADFEPGDHISLSVIYKYQVDMDGPGPTILVDREVLDFRVTKG